jgi:hypothetical protein
MSNSCCTVPEICVYDKQAADEEDRGFDLIFYGDSLVEMWRGTRADTPYSPRAQLPGVEACHHIPSLHCSCVIVCPILSDSKPTDVFRCQHRRACPFDAGIFHDHFQVAWRAAAFGMSGDTVARLHWRLLHGELPRRHLPRLLVVLIG